MRKKKLEISLVNVESIVDDISCDHSFEPEVWLAETASKLNTQFKELRDDLRQHKNAWSSSHYRKRLAFHYYNISFAFNELLRKHKIDCQSVVQWMVKCQVVLKEIPQYQKTEDLLKLAEDIERTLIKVELVRDQLSAARDVYKNSGEETDVQKVAASILALGDVTEDVAFTEYLSRCGSDDKKRVERTLRNITLLKAIAFLEDCLSDPDCNPISAGIHSFSLSKAYYAAGISNLGKRFQNTSGHIMKTCLSFKDNNTDGKQKSEES
uniref:Uncharacterized protein n=1 Tax=Lygus hesperus TaxID=30085 RepID=A0A0K8T8S9_LYGHE